MFKLLFFGENEFKECHMASQMPASRQGMGELPASRGVDGIVEREGDGPVRRHTLKYTASKLAPICCIASTSCCSFSRYRGVGFPRLGTLGIVLHAY